MIILCHMTGFTAIYPVVDAVSKSFALYIRHSLYQIIVTDLDSKFKGQFKGMAALLKIQHHMYARVHHDTILVEGFNRFRSSALSNMFLIEG